MLSCIRSRFIRHHLSLKQNINNLNSVLSPDLILDSIKRIGLDYRKRIYDPFSTLNLFISQILEKPSSCQSTVTSAIMTSISKNNISYSSNTAAYCKARKRLPVELLKDILRSLSTLCCEKLPEKWTFKGSSVKVVDGTLISMPDTLQNASTFPSDKINLNTGFPIARSSAVFELSTGAILKFKISAFQGKGSGEISSLRSLWSVFKEGDTLLGDALYGVFTVIAQASLRKIQVVAEYRKSLATKHLKSRSSDQIITLHKPYMSESLSKKEFDFLPSEVKVRVITVKIAPKGFRPKTKYIITTYTNSKIYPKQSILDLYKRRWLVETNLNIVKTYMGMNHLTTLSPDMIEKEILVHMICYNLIRFQMIIVAEQLALYPQQLSFTITQSMYIKYRQMNNLGKCIKDYLTLLTTIISNHLIAKRQNRFEPRAIKKHFQNAYYRLTMNRSLAKKILWKKH